MVYNEMEKNKLAIVVIVYNTSKLLAKQVECVRKFCKDDFDILVFDNSTEPSVIEDIKYLTTELNVEYFKLYSAESKGSRSNAFACNFAYFALRGKYNFFLYLDHDTFPLRDFSIPGILVGRAIGGVGQLKKKSYFMQNCLMWDDSIID